MGALWFNPADAVTRPDGSYLLNSTVTWPVENPVANTVGLDQRRRLFNAIGNGYAEYSFTDALKLRSSLGITANFDQFTFFAPRTIPERCFRPGQRAGSGGRELQRRQREHGQLASSCGNALDLLGGFTVQRQRGESIDSRNTRFSNDLLASPGSRR